MDVSELVHSDKWPLLYSLSMERIEKERLNIPVAAFRFWEQQDFKELLNEVMDKSAFYKFCPKEEKTQGISYLLLEMFKLRRHINVLNMQPEVASRFFNQKWSKPLTGYRIIKYMCKIKSVGIKKMFKELPVLLCENETTTAMNYLILALTAYKAAAEVIFDRLVNVTIVGQIIKPLLSTKTFSWSHQAIFTLIRSAANMFLMELLGEFHELKSQLLENEERIIKDIEGNTIEERTMNLITWFMHNDISDKPKSTISFEKADKGTKPQKEKSKRSSNGPEKQRAIWIDSTPEDVSKRTKLGCKIRMLTGYGDNYKLNAYIITTKEEVDYQFQYPERNKVIKEYKYIKDKYSWDDEFESDSGKTKSTNSPKIYDLRTPQKSLNKMEMYSDYTSGKFFNVEEDTQKRGALDSIQTKPTTSVKLVSKLASKHTATSTVDLILEGKINGAVKIIQRLKGLLITESLT